MQGLSLSSQGDTALLSNALCRPQAFDERRICEHRRSRSKVSDTTSQWNDLCGNGNTYSITSMLQALERRTCSHIRCRGPTLHSPHSHVISTQRSNMTRRIPCAKAIELCGLASLFCLAETGIKSATSLSPPINNTFRTTELVNGPP